MLTHQQYGEEISREVARTGRDALSSPSLEFLHLARVRANRGAGEVASGPPWLCPAFAFVPVLGFSIPSTLPGQRGITPIPRLLGYLSEQAIYMVNSVQLTRSARPSLAYRPSGSD
jgi:hypothetical protein